MDLELENGVTVDNPDKDGEVCIKIPIKHGGNLEEAYAYLSREDVVKILKLFDK